MLGRDVRFSVKHFNCVFADETAGPVTTIICKCMDRWMDVRVGGWVGYLDGWVGWRADGQTDEWMDGWMDAWMDGWM